MKVFSEEEFGTLLSEEHGFEVQYKINFSFVHFKTQYIQNHKILTIIMTIMINVRSLFAPFLCADCLCFCLCVYIDS